MNVQREAKQVFAWTGPTPAPGLYASFVQIFYDHPTCRYFLVQRGLDGVEHMVEISRDCVLALKDMPMQVQGAPEGVVYT